MSVTALPSQPYIQPTRSKESWKDWEMDEVNLKQYKEGSKTEREARISSQWFRFSQASQNIGMSSSERASYLSQIADGSIEGIHVISFTSSGEAADFAQRQVQRLQQGIERIGRDLRMLGRDKDGVREAHGDAAAEDFAQKVLADIERERGLLGSVAKILVEQFDVSGDILKDRDDGNYDLGSFSLTYTDRSHIYDTKPEQAPDIRLFLHTPDIKAPEGGNYNLVQVLDGIRRSPQEIAAGRIVDVAG